MTSPQMCCFDCFSGFAQGCILMIISLYVRPVLPPSRVPLYKGMGEQELLDKEEDERKVSDNDGLDTSLKIEEGLSWYSHQECY